MGTTAMTRRTLFFWLPLPWPGWRCRHVRTRGRWLADSGSQTDGLLQIMKAGPATPFQDRFDMLAPVIDHVFDLDAILRQSIGPTWDSLPPSQHDTLRPAFRRYTVASYVNNFDHFNGQRFTVEPQTRPVGNGEQVVRSLNHASLGQQPRARLRSAEHRQRLARHGRAGGWVDQPGGSPAIGFPSAAVPRRRSGAGGEPGH